MNTRSLSTRGWVAIVVMLHLIISLVHGMAHAQAQITMSAAANMFIYIVILAGPLLGLLLVWRDQRIGGGLIAVTLGASFVFGLVNHFLLISPDHVAHVTEQVRPLFTATAVLLALTEAAGAVLAVRLFTSLSFARGVRDTDRPAR